MKNNDLWKQYDEYTKALSENARKLAFAAAAISWFFKTQENTFPSNILVALLFIIAFFMADIMQYFSASLLLRCWTRKEEKKKYYETKTIEGDYDKPAWLDIPSFSFWVIKILSLSVGYFFIGKHIFK